MSLNNSVVTALEDILDLVVPHAIEFKSVARHLKGYDRQAAIKTIIQKAEANATLTRIQLFLIYNKLDEVVKKGDLP